MPINFPPGAPGATHSAAGVNWIWDGEKWVSQSTDEASLWQRDGDTLKPTNEGDDVQVGSLNGGPLAGLRNHFIGLMNVWQRGTSGTIPNNGDAYTTDRWYIRSAGSVGGTVTWARVTSPSGQTGKTGIGITTTGASSYVYIAQKIEASSLRSIQGREVTVSVYTDAAAPHIVIQGRVDGSTTTWVDRLAMTDEGDDRWSYTFTLPSGLIGSSSTNTGCLVFFYPNNGVDAQPDGTVSFWEPQFELGSLTPFETRPIGLELSLCQRYFYNHAFGAADTAFSVVYKTGNSTTHCPLPITYPVVMRTAPTVDVTGMTVRASPNGSGNPNGAAQNSFISARSANVAFAGVNGTLTTNQVGVMDFTGSATFDAEL